MTKENLSIALAIFAALIISALIEKNTGLITGEGIEAFAKVAGSVLALQAVRTISHVAKNLNWVGSK